MTQLYLQTPFTSSEFFMHLLSNIMYSHNQMHRITATGSRTMGETHCRQSHFPVLFWIHSLATVQGKGNVSAKAIKLNQLHQIRHPTKPIALPIPYIPARWWSKKHQNYQNWWFLCWDISLNLPQRLTSGLSRCDSKRSNSDFNLCCNSSWQERTWQTGSSAEALAGNMEPILNPSIICFLGPLICFDIPQGCSELSKLFYLIPPLPTPHVKTGHNLSSNWAGNWFYSSCSCCRLSCFLPFAAAVAFACFCYCCG